MDIEPCAELEAFWIHLTRNTFGGVTLLTSLTEIEAELSGTRLAEMAADLRRRVESGESLSAAMAAHSEVFGKHVLCLVEGGERAGVMEKAFMLILEQAWCCPKCILAVPPHQPRDAQA